MKPSIHALVLDSGERFPCLMDEHGIPLQFPLLFSFRDREAGGVARLRQRLLRIAELYHALTETLSEPGEPTFDLDWAILNRTVDVRDVENALFWLEEESDGQDWRGARKNNGSGGVSPTMRNKRVSAWADFMEWALVTSNWTRVSRPVRDQGERDLAFQLRGLLEDAYLEVAGSREVQPLSSREIEVVDDLLGPDANGRFSRSPFTPGAARRNWILYQLLRWSGMRLGEALKLCVEDIPPRETEADQILREVDGTALKLRIVRRVDDERDGRRNEPSVKRLGRSVPIPDRVLTMLWDYIDDLPDTTPYLIRTDDLQRPLSYGQASHICYDIRPHAVRLFDQRHEGDPHTLDGFRWHRLRHTRAVEMLPEYFPEGAADPLSQREFCDAFGWIRLSSADPYLRFLHRGSGEARWRNSLDRMGV